MDIQITTAIIGVASALLGSLVGGIASYFSTKSMRKMEWHLAQVERDINKREALYADFLAEANKYMVLSVSKKVNCASELSALINLESHIRLSSPALGSLVREVTACVLDHHHKDEKERRAYPELRDKFIEECQSEIERLKNNA